MISMCNDSKVRKNKQNMPYLATLSKKQKKKKILLINEKSTVKILKGSQLLPTSFCQCIHTPPNSGFSTFPSASLVAFISRSHLTRSTGWGSPEDECFAVTQTQFPIMWLSWKILAGCLPYLNSGFIFCNMKINEVPHGYCEDYMGKCV